MTNYNKRKSSWSSPQSIIIMIIVVLLFAYIASDIFVFKPEYNKMVSDVEMRYDSLSVYLEEKFPEIDRQLVDQTRHIQRQDSILRLLQEYVNEQSTDLDYYFDF